MKILYQYHAEAMKNGNYAACYLKSRKVLRGMGRVERRDDLFWEKGPPRRREKYWINQNFRVAARAWRHGRQARRKLGLPEDSIEFDRAMRLERE